MPVVSDFNVVTTNDFVLRSSNETKSYRFGTGGRHNSQAVLDLALFGGFRSNDENMSVRIKLNGHNLTTTIVNRWQSHSTIVLDRINVVVGPNILKAAGMNTLTLEPLWESDTDYLFVGPVVCHFHQAA